MISAHFVARRILSAVIVAVCVAPFCCQAGFAQEPPAVVPARPSAQGPLNLSLPAPGVVASRLASTAPRPDRWAGSIAATAGRGTLQLGFETAEQAVVDCQRGDYPGGGLGLLSLPFGRSTSRTDHCFR